LNLPTKEAEKTIVLESVDGHQIYPGGINVKVDNAHIKSGPNHSEHLDLIPIPTNHADIIFGLPWLRKHNPSITWPDLQIHFDSDFCSTNCVDTHSIQAVFKSPDEPDLDPVEQNISQNTSTNPTILQRVLNRLSTTLLPHSAKLLESVKLDDSNTENQRFSPPPSPDLPSPAPSNSYARIEEILPVPVPAPVQSVTPEPETQSLPKPAAIENPVDNHVVKQIPEPRRPVTPVPKVPLRPELPKAILKKIEPREPVVRSRPFHKNTPVTTPEPEYSLDPDSVTFAVSESPLEYLEEFPQLPAKTTS
ncbi:hypothetical protein AX774_g7013, partial [Zancudomyces culisetae]